ncbi:MAG: hypothetical protein MJ002_03100 [Paludibacteraceae bacterium]|nr:hypothetical protein [Paludibacteraceae bacterium]
MRYRFCILVTVAFMFFATLSADNWKSMDFRKHGSTTSWDRKSSYSSSWNYKGAELRGITRGGGGNSYNRGRNFVQANDRYNITTQNSGVRNNVSGSYSFNTVSPATGTRVHLVTSKTSVGGTGHHYFGGGSTVKTYRYAPEKNHYGENMGSATKIVVLPRSSSLSLVSNDDFQKDEDGRIGQSRIGRKGGTENGPSGQAGKGAAPLDDSLLVLLLMAVAMTVWKMRK